MLVNVAEFGVTAFVMVRAPVPACVRPVTFAPKVVITVLPDEF